MQSIMGLSRDFFPAKQAHDWCTDFAALSDKYTREDSVDWVLLVNEMKKELSAK
jgi:hypothetical protein